MVSVGELHHIAQTGALTRSEQELCGCGECFSECRFWPTVATRLESRVGVLDPASLARLRREVDRVRYLPQMLLGASAPRAYRRKRDHYREIVRELYESIREVSGCDLIIDASKDLSSLYLISGIANLEVITIHLVRDPRGVAYSWGKKRVRPEILGQRSYMARRSSVRLSGYWSYSNLLAEMVRYGRGRYLLVRYEDLVQEPVKHLREICEAARVPGADLSFVGQRSAALRRPSHILKGNPSRFESGRIEFHLDEEWREKLPRVERAAVTVLAAPLMARYRYFEQGRSKPEWVE